MVTGASRGIGGATALCLARPGRKLILVARTEAALQACKAQVEERGGEAEVRACNLKDPVAVAELAATSGELDGLILNAGMSNDASFLSTTPEAVAAELQLNYLTPVYLLGYHLPRMKTRGQGRIVAVGSLTSFVPFPGNATYAASKSALFTLMRSLRMELEDSGVSLGIVLPGHTATEMVKDLKASVPSMSPEAVGRMVARCYERGHSVVVPGVMNRLAASMFGAFPASSDSMLSRFAHVFVPKANA